MRPRVLVIIPAFNEEVAIATTIERVRQVDLPLDLLVINDGSKDRTADILAELGVNHINLPYNLGAGGAVQTGFRYARRNGYDMVVQVDADGQHDPADIPRLVAALQQTGAGMVVGSRFATKTGYRAPLDRRLGISYFAKFISRIIGYRVTDTTSGYRAINGRVLALFADWYPPEFAEVESLVYLHRHGVRVCEIPVVMHERQGGVSHISAIRGLIFSIRATLAILISMLQGGARG